MPFRLKNTFFYCDFPSPLPCLLAFIMTEEILWITVEIALHGAGMSGCQSLGSLLTVNYMGLKNLMPLLALTGITTTVFQSSITPLYGERLFNEDPWCMLFIKRVWFLRLHSLLQCWLLYKYSACLILPHNPTISLQASSKPWLVATGAPSWSWSVRPAWRWSCGFSCRLLKHSTGRG